MNEQKNFSLQEPRFSSLKGGHTRTLRTPNRHDDLLQTAPEWSTNNNTKSPISSLLDFAKRTTQLVNEAIGHLKKNPNNERRKEHEERVQAQKALESRHDRGERRSETDRARMGQPKTAT